jgi:hypothetical protein
MVFPRATVGRFVVPKIGIPVSSHQFPRKGEDHTGRVAAQAQASHVHNYF